MRTKDRHGMMVTRAAQEIAVGPEAVLKLGALVRRAFKAQERLLSCGEAAYRRMGRHADVAKWKVEEYAGKLGLHTAWPGLYPSFTLVTGHTWYLPTD